MKMSEELLCPLRDSACVREGCAIWYVSDKKDPGRCAIKDIALSLLHIWKKMPSEV